jgi:DNA-binding CsgD family transcriptional regulator
VIDTESRAARGLVPLLVVSGVVVLVSFGQARGMWLSNVHNGLLALAFTLVGAYVLFERPTHREGRLFLATGVVEAVLFFGRQVGHSPTSAASEWLGWLGVWPTAVALALTTLSVLCFPDGRLPSRPWRWIAAVVVVLSATSAALSAIWPVEYASAGVTAAHPLYATSPAGVADVWSAIAHPTYAGSQLLWVVVVAVRWRTAGPSVRRQLTWLVAAAAVSVLALGIGLVATDSPRAGLLTAALVPIAAGLAIVHGQHVMAYSALSWLSRTAADPAELPTELARTVAEALDARAATLWMGSDELHAVGVWPETDDDIPPTTTSDLRSCPGLHTRIVRSRGTVVGVLAVARDRADQLSLSESRLFEDLASQASLVVDHIQLADVIARQRRSGHLDGFTPREREVLELMARGRTNAAICDELHLSIKTVEPIVSTIFAKLGLHSDAANNRRVLAVLAYLRSRSRPLARNPSERTEVPREEPGVDLLRRDVEMRSGERVQRLVRRRELVEEREARLAVDLLVVPRQQEFDRDRDRPRRPAYRLVHEHTAEDRRTDPRVCRRKRDPDGAGQRHPGVPDRCVRTDVGQRLERVDRPLPLRHGALDQRRVERRDDRGERFRSVAGSQHRVHPSSILRRARPLAVSGRVDGRHVESVADDRLPSALDQSAGALVQAAAVTHEQQRRARGARGRRPQNAGDLAEEEAAVLDGTVRRLRGELQLHGQDQTADPVTRQPN